MNNEYWNQLYGQPIPSEVDNITNEFRNVASGLMAMTSQPDEMFGLNQFAMPPQGMGMPPMMPEQMPMGQNGFQDPLMVPPQAMQPQQPQLPPQQQEMPQQPPMM